MIATSPLRWTIADLDRLPDDGSRYEIIDGELFVTRAPHIRHQSPADTLCTYLKLWSWDTGLGQAFTGAGVVFSPQNAVIPDVIWVARDRLETIFDEAGHLTAAPDLAVEVVSAGQAERDRHTKLNLYSRYGVLEYWIVDRFGPSSEPSIEVYRRTEGELRWVETLGLGAVLTSPLLPGFSCPCDRVFAWP